MEFTVYDEQGQKMADPEDVRDMVNDSAHGILEYLNYKKRYEYLKEKMIQQQR